MGESKTEYRLARRVGEACGLAAARFGVGTFRGHPVFYAPIYPNVGAVPSGPLGIGIKSFLLCNTFVWRQHLKGRRWATSILLHETAHLKDFEENPWQLVPLVLCRMGARHFHQIRVLQYLFLLYLEGKANFGALEEGASPFVLALSYLTYLRAFRKSLRMPPR